MSRFICWLFAICSMQAQAGASNAQLNCQATNPGGSGVSLHGEVPGDFAAFNLRLENRHGSKAWTDTDGVIHTVVAFRKGVFTLTLQLNDHSSLIMYAIPSSVKATGGDQRLVDADFDATLLHAPRPGFDPKLKQDMYIRNVPMRCHFLHRV